jgi:hypothetical protein
VFSEVLHAAESVAYTASGVDREPVKFEDRRDTCSELYCPLFASWSAVVSKLRINTHFIAESIEARYKFLQDFEDQRKDRWPKYMGYDNMVR